MLDISLSIPQGVAKKKVKSASVYRLNLAILVAVAIIGLTYLFIVNSLGTKGYSIRKLEEQVRVSDAELKTLQMQVSELQSINRIQTEAQKLNFVPASNVTYLKEADFALK